MIFLFRIAIEILKKKLESGLISIWLTILFPSLIHWSKIYISLSPSFLVSSKRNAQAIMNNLINNKTEMNQRGN